jgi:aminoglycoside phosphotransferase (APT) family kinase protein
LESITKNRQPLPTLRAMVARAYGDDQVSDGESWVRELGHGWFNVAYRIRLRDGRNVVLKIAPPADVEVMSFERGAMANELTAIALIHERTSVPVPTVDFADRTRQLCDADYFFMPYVDAENLGIVKEGLPASELAAYHEALGAANRQLNTIRGKAFGALAGPGEASWRTAFTSIVESVLRDGERRSVELGCGYDEVRALVEEHAGSLDEVVEPRLVEWDLYDDNVLVKNGSIVAIIDHERAFYGDPLMEGCLNALVLPAVFSDATAFLRGYGRDPLTETELTRRRLYTLHLMLVLVVKAAYREYTDTGRHEWPRRQLAHTMALFGRHIRLK